MQSPWQERQKGNTEEKKVQPNLYTIHARHVITIPKDVQLAQSTHEKELSSVDETTIITSKDDTFIMMIWKVKSKGGKMTTPQGWILWILSEEEDKILARNELINVTMMKKRMTIQMSVYTWHCGNHLMNNNEKQDWSIVVISGTVHRLLLKTSFHPLLWTSSGLTGSWKTKHLY